MKTLHIRLQLLIPFALFHFTYILPRFTTILPHYDFKFYILKATIALQQSNADFIFKEGGIL